MLADLAVQSGYRALVIDRFGDLDTRQSALAVQVVDGFSLLKLQPAIEQLQHRYSFEAVIIGSGLVADHESLLWLHENFTLLGNTPETLVQTRPSSHFFQALSELDINFPETSLQPPSDNSACWLSKPLISEGGIGIKLARDRIGALSYWQRYQPGVVYSALFVAGGGRAQVLGFHRQWQTQHGGGQDFIFSGLLNCPDSEVRDYRILLQLWIDKLTAHFHLCGLNGIDFIIDQGQCWFLEINARPPASIAVYPRDLQLLQLHIDAVAGRLPGPIITDARSSMAYQLIYASAPITIADDFPWPEWTFDRPEPGTNFDTNQAICSIIASAHTVDGILQTLQCKIDELYQLFKIKEHS